MAHPYGMTFFTIKKLVADKADDLVESGTATGGSATTLVDTGRFTDATDTRLKGVNVYVGNGTGQSRETRGTAFTPASDTITIPTGTALDNTSEYMLTRRFTQTQILNAIRSVLWARGVYGKDYLDQSLIAGSPLVNATFYDNSGTFPNGWTAAGAGGLFAQQSTISKHGRYSMRMISDGTNACSQTQTVPNVGLYRGKSITLRCWAFCDTANRAYIRVDDGIDTTTGSFTLPTANDGWGNLYRETPSLSVSNRASRILVTLGITAGTAVTARFSAPYIVGGPYWNEWDMPVGSPTCITRVSVEDYQEGPFTTQLARDAFDVVRESTQRLRISATIPVGRILEIKGRTYWPDHATAATDDDTVFAGNPEALAAAAAAALLQTRGNGSPEDVQRIANLKAVAVAHGFSGRAVAMPVGALDLVRD